MLSQFFKPRDPRVTLAKFAVIEADSAWQYLNAISFADGIVSYGLLFDNFCEELDHASKFRQLSNGARGDAIKARTPLIEDGHGLPFFLAVAREAEFKIGKRFRKYARNISDTELAEVFGQISEEEMLHDSRAWHCLVAVSETIFNARYLCARAWISVRLREVSTHIDVLREILTAAPFLVIYYIFGPFFCSMAKGVLRKPVRRELRPFGQEM